VLEEELKTDEEMLSRLCATFKAGEEILCQRSSIKLLTKYSCKIFY
jgi:hypothetical protein